eukprot:1082536-Prymnesium_polylepis.1
MMNAANSSTGGTAGSAHAHPGNVWIVRCVVCGGPCDAADAASRQGVVTTVRLRRGRGITMQSWMRQIEAAAWGATLDGWNSPGSSLVPPGFAQKPRRVQ